MNVIFPTVPALLVTAFILVVGAVCWWLDYSARRDAWQREREAERQKVVSEYRRTLAQRGAVESAEDNRRFAEAALRIVPGDAFEAYYDQERREDPL